MKSPSLDPSTRALAALLGAIMLALTILGAKALGGQAPADGGALYLFKGADTVVADRFRRSPGLLEGSVQVKGQPRLDYLVAIEPGDVVRSLTLGVFPAGSGPEAAPIQRVRVTMKDDSALVETAAGIMRIVTKAGAIPMFGNALALMELFTRRARTAGGTSEIPYFAMNGGATLMLGVKPAGPDSFVVSVAGQEQRLRVDAVGRIIGGSVPAAKLEFVRAGPEAALALRITMSEAPIAPKTDYSAPAGAPYTAEEVSIAGPNGARLGGTLTRPKDAAGRLPAVVTITGSGQQDRDEYIPFAGGVRLFRQVADTLSRRGIAVLRLDDRGIGASGGDPRSSTTADFADDIRAGLAYLRTRPDIDPARLALVGHSEGGLIAPMIAATDRALRAIVVLAGPAEPGIELSMAQNRYAVEKMPGLTSSQQDSILRAARAQLAPERQTIPWIKFFMTFDPASVARQVTAPTLILQGATDRQVPKAQAEKLAAFIRGGGNRDVTVRVFPAKNHLFIDDPDGNFANYDRLKTNQIGGDVLGAIADWLVVKLAAKGSR